MGSPPAAAAAAAAFIVVDPSDLDRLPAPQLITFLLTSFRRSDYDKVAQILASRERSTTAASMLQEQLKRAHESIDELKAEKKMAEVERDKWRGKFCRAEVHALKLFDENNDLKVRLEMEKKKAEVGSCRCGVDCNSWKERRCSVKLEACSETRGDQRGNLIEIGDSDEG